MLPARRRACFRAGQGKRQGQEGRRQDQGGGRLRGVSALPPDIDRPRKDKQERLDWFLASIYCACKVAGDGCTGHFYTLSSCNPNACAMPLYMRKVIADEIDAGKTDRQIFDSLLDRYGPTLTRPHLVP